MAKYRMVRNSHEYSLDVEFYSGNVVITFRDMGKEMEGFPAIVGDFTRER